MEQVDRNSILEHYKDVKKISEVIGEWESGVVSVWECVINECPITLKIKVKRIAPNTYIGVANYGIAYPSTHLSYRSMQPQHSVHDALEDALKGFLSSWKPEYKDQTKFELDKNW